MQTFEALSAEALQLASRLLPAEPFHPDYPTMVRATGAALISAGIRLIEDHGRPMSGASCARLLADAVAPLVDGGT